MIVDIRDTDDQDFLRHWAERAWDDVQLAQIKAIQLQLIKYAMEAWRPVNMLPPAGPLLICACDEGLVLMKQNQNQEWRTAMGTPHKPPYAWMPAPTVPKRNGRGFPGV